MKTRSNMPLFVLEVSDVKALSNSQINLLRCGDWLVKKDASGEHPYQVTFKKEGVGMCLTYHDASVIETQSYDWNGSQHKWVYNSEDKTELPVNEGDLTVDDLEVKGDANVLGDLDITGDISVDETSNVKVYENIVDKDGHLRFIEGDITANTISGVSYPYKKWSLSGSHLMIVVCVQIENNATYNPAYNLFITLPEWVADKVIPIVPNGLVSRVTYLFWDDETSSSQNGTAVMYKDADTKQLKIYNASMTATAKRTGRYVFDLLIDNE